MSKRIGPTPAPILKLEKSGTRSSETVPTSTNGTIWMLSVTPMRTSAEASNSDRPPVGVSTKSGLNPDPGGTADGKYGPTDWNS